MSMRALEDIREMLCKELDEIAHKGEMSAGDLETVHKLTGTIKNIDKIEMYEDDGYSQGGDWRADMSGTYGHSYRHRDSMGRYSRDGNDGGGSYRVGRRGYSRTGNIHEQLEQMMSEATTDKERNAIRRCMDEMR